MSDDFEEHSGLLEDDPALDYILYQEMEKEVRDPQSQKNGGCLSLILFLLVPSAGIYLLFDLIASALQV